MRPSKAIIESMQVKGFDIFFQPNAKDIVFLNSKNIGDSQRENLRNKYGYEIFEDFDSIVVYDARDYKVWRGQLVSVDKIKISTYPWIFVKEGYELDIRIKQHNARILDLTDWIGDIPGTKAFYGSNYEIIKLGKEARLVGNMINTFCGNSRLEAVEIESVVQPESSIAGMFRGCVQLNEVVIPEFYLQSVIDARYAFERCTKLQKVDLSTLNRSCNVNGIFDGCSSIGYDFYDVNIQTGGLQSVCKQLFNHDLFECVYNGTALFIYHTNYPDDKLQSAAAKQNMDFARIGGSVLVYNEENFSLLDRETLLDLVDIEEVKRLFPNLNTMDLDEYDENNDIRDLSAFQ